MSGKKNKKTREECCRVAKRDLSTEPEKSCERVKGKGRVQLAAVKNEQR